MKINDVNEFTQGLIPKLFSFSQVLIPDSKKAKELLRDAYSVFLVKEKAYILEVSKPETKKEKMLLKKFFLIGIMQQMYKNAFKESFKLKAQTKNMNQEYKSFYSLDFKLRASLFLKEKVSLKEEQIMMILDIERYQVIQSLYNAREMITLPDSFFMGNYESH